MSLMHLGIPCDWHLQALRVASDSLSKQGSFEAVLREADSAEALLKRRDQAGTSPLLDITLLSQPRVFTLAIVWESAKVTSWHHHLGSSALVWFRRTHTFGLLCTSSTSSSAAVYVPDTLLEHSLDACLMHACCLSTK